MTSRPHLPRAHCSTGGSLPGREECGPSKSKHVPSVKGGLRIGQRRGHGQDCPLGGEAGSIEISRSVSSSHSGIPLSLTASGGFPQ